MPTLGGRLREERERLRLSQQELADKCGVTMRSQRNYEKDERLPDAGYLTALQDAGADVTYVLTGDYLSVAQAKASVKEKLKDRQLKGLELTADERELIDLYRAAPLAVRLAAVAALASIRR